MKQFLAVIVGGFCLAFGDNSREMADPRDLIVEIPIDENGSIMKKQVYIDTSNSKSKLSKKNPSPETVTKYFLGSKGEKIDLKNYYAGKLLSDREKYGNISPPLWKKLKGINEAEIIKVAVEFKSESTIQNDGKKLDLKASKRRQEKSFVEGAAEMESLLGKKVKEFSSANMSEAALERRMHVIELSKKDIIKLQRSNKILHIWERPKVSPDVHKPSVSMAYMYSVNNRNTSFEVEFPWLFTGTNSAVGIWEPKPPDAGVSQISCGNLLERAVGAPLLPADDHSVVVSSIVRNCGITDPAEWERGGSPELSMLKLASIQQGDNDMTESFEWLTSWQGRPVDVVNWSWMVPRELGGDAERLGWIYDRHVDVAAADYPYVLTVGSAGNRGYNWNYTRTPDLQQCIDNSLQAGTGWTEYECTRVDKWGYNNIIVGSGTWQNSDFFPSWRNGPSGNEVPHIMSTGYQIEMPWFKPYHNWQYTDYPSAYTGTSFAAAAVTSLAANMINQYPSLRSYPEATRAIIMVSSAARLTYATDDWPYGWIGANRNSVGYGVSDLKGGLGMPKQEHIRSVVEGSCCGGPFPMRGGYRTATLYPDDDRIVMDIPIIAWEGNVVKFAMTWVSNPSNYTPGDYYPPDDLDLYVANPSSEGNSISYKNTTELVVVDHLDPGTLNYTVTIQPYSRPSSNLPGRHPIYVAIAWREEIFTGIRTQAPSEKKYFSKSAAGKIKKSG